MRVSRLVNLFLVVGLSSHVFAKPVSQDLIHSANKALAKEQTLDSNSRYLTAVEILSAEQNDQDEITHIEYQVDMLNWNKETQTAEEREGGCKIVFAVNSTAEFELSADFKFKLTQYSSLLPLIFPQLMNSLPGISSDLYKAFNTHFNFHIENMNNFCVDASLMPKAPNSTLRHFNFTYTYDSLSNDNKVRTILSLNSGDEELEKGRQALSGVFADLTSERKIDANRHELEKLFILLIKRAVSEAENKDLNQMTHDGLSSLSSDK